MGKTSQKLTAKTASLNFFWILFLYLHLFILFIYYFWLRWVFVAGCRLSVVVMRLGGGSRSSSLIALCKILIAVASLVTEKWAPGIMGCSSCGMRALSAHMHGPSCPVACGIFPDQGLNPYLLHWQVDS